MFFSFSLHCHQNCRHRFSRNDFCSKFKFLICLISKVQICQFFQFVEAHNSNFVFSSKKKIFSLKNQSNYLEKKMTQIYNSMFWNQIFDSTVCIRDMEITNLIEIKTWFIFSHHLPNKNANLKKWSKRDYSCFLSQC